MRSAILIDNEIKRLDTFSPPPLTKGAGGILKSAAREDDLIISKKIYLTG